MLIELDVQPLAGAGRHLVVLTAVQEVLWPSSRLILGGDGEARAWAEYVGEHDGRPVFAVAAGEPALRGGARPRAWLVPANLVAGVYERWPSDAELIAEVDSLGPGERTAWLAAGSNQGVRPGDTWWLRVGGQPAARCDVRFVAADVCFCRVVALASDAALRPGSRVSLWPTPAQRRTGRASTAVCYVETRGDHALVWVAAPVGVACPPEPHVGFFHGDRYVGYGLVERCDERFWYVRLTPAGSVAGTSGPRPGSYPGTCPVGLRVGDEAVIRTWRDIAERRYAAHVFGLTAQGALVDAGEADGLAEGCELLACRLGKVMGTVRVRQTQHTYAVVEVEPAHGAGELQLQVGDELRFARTDAGWKRVGTIQSVVSPTLFAVELVTEELPASTPLAVRAAGRTLAVALLVGRVQKRAGGFVVPGSLTQPLAAGMSLEVEVDGR